MSKTQPFDNYTHQYEDWFENNKYIYLSEVEAVRTLLPKTGAGVEIGVGSGKFAEPLGIRYGVEPSGEMRELAMQRGIDAVDSIGEALPYEDKSFDFALIVTTICFLDDIVKAFREVHRILKPEGSFIIGFIDKESPIGKMYQKHKEENVFYRIAEFFSTEEVIDYLNNNGFTDFEFAQTVFGKMGEINEQEPVKEGYGEGSFVVVKAKKA